MSFHRYQYKTTPAAVNVSCFQGASGVDEYHLAVCPSGQGDAETQLQWLNQAYGKTLKSLGLERQTVVLRRFFCSDLPNHAVIAKSMPFCTPASPDEPCAVSWICQPPVTPAQIVLWAYHMKDPGGNLDKSQEGNSLILQRNELSHQWTTGMTCRDCDSSYEQTRGILQQYRVFLEKKNSSLADNLIRTWFFVRDIDANYSGLTKARAEFFARHGLTPDTHFVASTGIEGSDGDASVKVTMDAYSISSVRPEQIQYLRAPDRLSPTHVYGVTFERGASVAYRDRKHVLISGTASIDHKGQILYPGDLLGQLERTIENIQALLCQAGSTLDEVCMLIAYVRDPSDSVIVQQQMRERFGDLPIQVLFARVCRPGWLVEIEGMAIVSESNPQLPEF